MAKKKKGRKREGAEGEAPKKSKKKLIIMITVIVLIGGFVAKTILLKPAPPTRQAGRGNAKLAEIDAREPVRVAQRAARRSRCRSSRAPRARRPDHDHHDDARRPTAAGPVDSLDAITINLAAGHYLKVALALQVPVGLDPSDGQDHRELGGRGPQGGDRLPVGPDPRRPGRKASARSRSSIGDAVCRKTDGKVLTIYFTDFVMQ